MNIYTYGCGVPFPFVLTDALPHLINSITCGRSFTFPNNPDCYYDYLQSAYNAHPRDLRLAAAAKILRLHNVMRAQHGGLIRAVFDEVPPSGLDVPALQTWVYGRFVELAQAVKQEVEAAVAAAPTPPPAELADEEDEESEGEDDELPSGIDLSGAVTLEERYVQTSTTSYPAGEVDTEMLMDELEGRIPNNGNFSSTRSLATFIRDALAQLDNYDVFRMNRGVTNDCDRDLSESEIEVQDSSGLVDACEPILRRLGITQNADGTWSRRQTTT